MTPVLTDAESVVVLVGAAASGKTTLRQRLVAEGAAPAVILSLDDERTALWERAVLSGAVPRPLQDYSLPAVRRCDAAANERLAQGRGYLADATHLRRRERVAHIRAAHAAGLPAIAVLLPAVPLDELRRRNAERPAWRRVPEHILARHAHRRDLLSPAMLREEGFDDVVELAAAE
jgi:predicted kinase